MQRHIGRQMHEAVSYPVKRGAPRLGALLACAEDFPWRLPVGVTGRPVSSPPLACSSEPPAACNIAATLPRYGGAVPPHPHAVHAEDASAAWAGPWGHARPYRMSQRWAQEQSAPSPNSPKGDAGVPAHPSTRAPENASDP